MKQKHIIRYINYLVMILSTLTIVFILVQCTYAHLIALTISVLVVLAMIISNVLINNKEEHSKSVLSDENKSENKDSEDISDNSETRLSSNIYFDLVKNIDNTLNFAQQLEQKLIKLADSIQLVAAISYERKADVLEISSCYAVAKTEQKQSLRLDEGMTGQVVKDKQPVELPITEKMSLEIVSGLGKAKPNYLYIVPVFERDEVIGVVELATFIQLNSTRVEFLIEALKK